MKVCAVDGCTERHLAKDLCEYHYHCHRRGDVARLLGPRVQPPCERCGQPLRKSNGRFCSECVAAIDAGRARIDQFVNPFICVCTEPQADPAVDFGMCQVCKRPVVAFMRIMQVAS